MLIPVYSRLKWETIQFESTHESRVSRTQEPKVRIPKITGIHKNCQNTNNSTGVAGHDTLHNCMKMNGYRYSQQSIIFPNHTRDNNAVVFSSKQPTRIQTRRMGSPDQNTVWGMTLGEDKIEIWFCFVFVGFKSFRQIPSLQGYVM